MPTYLQNHTYSFTLTYGRFYEVVRYIFIRIIAQPLLRKNKQNKTVVEAVY